jgi:hypothetical protein
MDFLDYNYKLAVTNKFQEEKVHEKFISGNGDHFLVFLFGMRPVSLN